MNKPFIIKLTLDEKGSVIGITTSHKVTVVVTDTVKQLHVVTDLAPTTNASENLSRLAELRSDDGITWKQTWTALHHGESLLTTEAFPTKAQILAAQKQLKGNNSHVSTEQKTAKSHRQNADDGSHDTTMD